MSTLRKVRYSLIVDGYNKWKNIEPKEGLFHQWGEFSEVHHDGLVRWTIAVVEGEDGTVYRVPPEGLQFLDSVQQPT